MTVGHPLWLVLSIPLGAFTLWSWQTGRVVLARGRRVLALALRLAILALLLGGLAGLSIAVPQKREATVFVADVSASDARARSAMQQTIQTASATQGAGDEVGVVSTAADAAVEEPVSPLATFQGFQSVLDTSSTNLERGLELASSIMPDGYRRRVVLLSDGQQTEGDAVLAASLLRARGIRVDVLPEKLPGGPDVFVDSVETPSELKTNERSSVVVRLRSTVDTPTQINLFRDRALVASRQLHMRIGSLSLAFSQPPLSRGFHTYRVQITPRVDTQPGNDSGSAFTIVGGPPRVLVISSNPGEATNVLSALRSTGLAVDFSTPGQVVPALESLQRYASVVIVDTPAEALGPQLMEVLVPYVRDLGHGLIVLGGQQAFGLGGYGGTPLETALPVSMNLPRRPDLPSVGVVLIVESLEAALPVDISKEAAKGVVQLLTEEDRVAVEDVPDSGDGWAVRLRPVLNKGAINAAIQAMTPGDPQTYASALQSAARTLERSPTQLRHIILLGDGDAHDSRYAAIAAAIHKRGITISTVATNAVQPGDAQTMKTIAKGGGGRYYVAEKTANIPHIFLHEARTVARSGVVRGRFVAHVVSPNPMLRDLRRIPPLDGYVATTLKQRAEMVLASDKLDPVLADWQFGLGRSVLWSSDAAGLWTRQFVDAPGVNRFWADVVGWTLPSSDANQLFVSTTRSQGQARVAVDVPSSLGTSPTVQARVNGPGGGTTVNLQPAGPERYTGSFAAMQQGAYYVTVEAHGAGHAAVGAGGIDVPYPDEYRTTGTNLSMLHEIAAAGGGTVLSRSQSVWSDSLPSVTDQRPITGLLWFLALLLLPIDVAVRRLVVSRRDLVALRAALIRLRSRPEAA